MTETLLTAEDARSSRSAAGAPVVLVVDDQAQVRRLIERMLEPSGFDVVEASNGEEALGLLAAGLSPRVIVLDLWMPIVDGWEFLDKAPTTVPTIIISGVEEETHPLPGHVVRFLKKPIGREDLMAAVRDAERRAPPLE